MEEREKEGRERERERGRKREKESGVLRKNSMSVKTSGCHFGVFRSLLCGFKSV